MSYFKMSKLALKWAMTKPPTVKYPFAPRRVIAGSRGQLEFTRDNCVWCKVCGKKCPTNAIIVNRQEKRWIIDRLSCISCGACVDACPKDCLKMTTSHGNPAVTKEHAE